MIKITIITAAYNSGRTIRDTIESVLRQTYKDIEYLIVDGGSTDETLEIIKKYEPRFSGRMRYISEPDNGLYDAMNKGIRMATGDVAGILNSDDFFYDDRVLETVANAFMNDATLDCTYGDLLFVDAEDTHKVVRKWKGSQYRQGAFFHGWHPAHPTFYCRTEYFRKYGGFDTTFRVSADFELMLRLIEKHHLKNKYIARNLVYMRTGGVSTGSVKNILRGNKGVLQAFKKNGYNVPPLYIAYRWTPKIWNMLVQKAHLRQHK